MVAPAFVDAMILGEHGDTSFPALSIARIGGVVLDDFAGKDVPLDAGEIGGMVRQAGYRIIEGKGYTSFGVATAIVRICEAILRDEHAVLPVSTMLTGEYGISGLSLSLPCVLGAAGIERVLTPDLSGDETASLLASAHAIDVAWKCLTDERGDS
jgi:L-lactate dehydrogenase